MDQSPHTTEIELLTPEIKTLIDQAYTQPFSHWSNETKSTIYLLMEQLDKGKLRISSPSSNGWVHQPHLQKTILSYFKTQEMKKSNSDYLYFQDKIPSKYMNTSNVQERIVPPTHVRYGAYIGKNCVLMPCFVNIGAYVDDGTMLDTWCTVGAGAQVGKNCHISGGVGIGGVLEPPQASPTIIEDNCFIGARSEVAEGVIIRKGAVLAMGTFISQSTKIYNRMTKEITFGEVPQDAVVIPGSLPSNDGSYSSYAAIIVKFATASTREKTSLNEILREN